MVREPGKLSLTIPSLVFLSAGFKLSRFPNEFSGGLQQKMFTFCLVFHFGLFPFRFLRPFLPILLDLFLWLFCLPFPWLPTPPTCPLQFLELSLQVHIHDLFTLKCFRLPQLLVSFLDMVSPLAAFFARSIPTYLVLSLLISLRFSTFGHILTIVRVPWVQFGSTA